MKKMMILGASILQLPAIDKAIEMGHEVIAVDMNPDAIGFSRDVIKEVISTIDTDAILKSARKHNIDGIMTLASDMPMRSVATVCKEMGLVGISEETALKATNKALMRDALKLAGVPIPQYYKVSTYSDFEEAVKKIQNAGYQCIVKPADNSGSRGVNLIGESDNLEHIFEYCHQYSRNGEIMVEEYMTGPEVSVETLAVEGDIHVIQITDKLTTGAPYFVEMGHSQPSMLDPSIQEQIKRVAIDANIAIGIDNGPSHTEIKITPDGPKIVELGARLGGDNITTHLVPLSTGIDLVECCINLALGESPDIKPKYTKGSAIRYMQTSNGLIKSIIGIDKARSIDGVVQVSIVHGVGEQVTDIRSSTDRAGFVISQRDSALMAIKSAERAVESISFII